MSRSQSPNENGQAHADSVILTDEFGRSLSCYIEHSVELHGQTYVLLIPVDTPVEIFAWPDDEESDEPIPVTEEEIDQIFNTAKAVLEEQNLNLKRTAVTLTVSGILPDFSEESEEEEEPLGDEEYEELQLLANFYEEEQEYAIYAPLDPFFILARLNDRAEPELLNDEEFKQLEPLMPTLEQIIQERLFEDLD